MLITRRSSIPSARLGFLALPASSFILVMAASCSSSDTTPTATTSDAATEAAPDTSTTAANDASAIDTGSGGFACEPTDLKDVPEVPFTVVMGDPPVTPLGGTPGPGRYVLTKQTFYQQFDANGLLRPNDTFQSVIEINDDQTEIRRSFAFHSGPDAGPDSAPPPTPSGPQYNVASFTVDPNGTFGPNLITHYRCSSIAGQVGAKGGSPFTATPGKILTFAPSSGYTLVYEFTAK